MTDDIKISIRNLYKIFGNNPAKAMEKVREGMSKDDLLDQTGHVLGLNDISLDMRDRKIQVVMGLSGSGKSTLIRHLNRLIDPTAGEVIVDGEDVLAMDDTRLRDLRRFKMSMVFQKFALLPHRTVVENAVYGLLIQGIKEDEASKRARHWLDRVGLTGYEDYYPGQLSGGMQQRVGLARALATDADILLMDEAFSALDPLIRMDMQGILLELQEELHKTIVFITHDLDEALRLGDNIAILRDGALIQTGDGQDIVLHPADDYIADFTREINRAKVVRLRALQKPLNGAVPAGDPLADSMVLEDALEAIAGAEGHIVPVKDASGKVTGQVHLADAVAAMHA
ncbi:glycine betaine/proline transport system ATP-binding protein [Aliiroseovarius halocynthiae]|uniref:Quaternary amine transport ATP-binding protein n=1 Tax=Aliiroseovarius halocynthiae TaxID=985055 RepID=A0A545SWQ0_9RHOB|nr:betaine/proline/choline family ABC transporter ATP-binding protein [Aliiroseovarius halocynthiae]TQV69374.1 betaine/proline/choline family ABC transporter ATP-binding protein [Aliiroseovarius halocynthiae]SMR72671.1 glycine betaine/proline transport system ATP-binding protein [Aliiroseovarius halocynthiae]